MSLSEASMHRALSRPRPMKNMSSWEKKRAAYRCTGVTSERISSGSRLRRPARRCRFVEEGMAFVRHDGMLSPCMALLRSSRLYWEGKTRLNQHLFFGNVRSQPLDRLWRSPEYAAFRQNVRAFEFSPCCRCSQCDNWELSLPDCYGNPAPSCGACLWSEGIISCP